MALSISTSDVIAGLALLLSAYATWKTLRFNDRQKRLIETQEALNRRLLAKEEGELRDLKSADLGASFIKIGSNDYRLKIYNKGKAAARNVRIEFPEGNDCVIDSDVEGKFPLESLEQHQAVELLASVEMGTRSKHPIRLRWEDDAELHNEKVVYPTI